MVLQRRGASSIDLWQSDRREVLVGNGIAVLDSSIDPAAWRSRGEWALSEGHPDVSSLFQLWVLPFVSIFFIVDPFAVIPTFLTMTAADSPGRRKAMALKASVATVIILLCFATAGGMIFKLFGVTLPAFRIAGGLVLALSAIEMLRAERATRENRDEVQEGVEKPDVAVTPLAMPMLAGPGAISTVMMLMNQAKPWFPESLPVYFAILVTGAATYLVLQLSELVSRVLGKTGINVMTRLMGLVLLTISVQFVIDGIRETFST
ncbi:MAG: MarC family protein [Deltaproteobacteria bacterium]|nr:MarC family protein [Deltaproteobacteria bacterium]